MPQNTVFLATSSHADSRVIVRGT